MKFHSSHHLLVYHLCSVVTTVIFYFWNSENTVCLWQKSSFGLESANQLAFAVFRVTQVVFFWAAFAFSTKCVTGKPTMKKQVVFLPGLCSFNITSRIWLSGRALNLWLEGHGADPWQERQENCFLLQSRLCVLTLTAVSIPPLRYHSST